MTYSTLSKIDSTPEQDLGLNIAFKRDVNDKRTTAQSPEEYLAQFVIAKLEDLAVHNVTGEQLDRIFQAEKLAFERGDTTKLESIAAILGVTLKVEIPLDAPVGKAEAVNTV